MLKEDDRKNQMRSVFQEQQFWNILITENIFLRVRILFFHDNF